MTDLSKPTVTSMLESGAQQMSCMSLSCATNLLRTVQCSLSCSEPKAGCELCSSSRAHISKIRSSDPLARYFPSGENLTHVIEPVCLLMLHNGICKSCGRGISGVRDSSSMQRKMESMDHILILPSRPPVANLFPSWLTSTVYISYFRDSSR
uniref:YBL03-19 n=1 Tax=Saccharomyces cerevisiae TaxID=4932 RepID=E9P9X1_YEASX|nr:YBL03-19 [Saccharomyces cerevisiae]